MNSSTGTALRPSWEELPGPLRDGLADRLGAITTLAARLQLASGDRLFAKGIPAGHPLAGKYRTEADTARLLPATAPAPRLRWDGPIAGWVVLVFDDIDGRHADLSPGSPRRRPGGCRCRRAGGRPDALPGTRRAAGCR